MSESSEVAVRAVSTSNSEKYTTSSHKPSAKLTCPGCHANGLRRVQRKGFWQRFVAARFGYFPWECKFCKNVHLLRDRGVRRKRSGKD